MSPIGIVSNIIYNTKIKMNKMVKNNIIDKIIISKRMCVFISPHLDDAVLSAGNVLLHINGKVPMEVITVFTKASTKNPTLSIKAFLKQCKEKNIQTLYRKRRKEDKQALKNLKATITHLGLPDALYRTLKNPNIFRKLLAKIIPEFIHVYPVYRVHITSGKVSKGDMPTYEVIRKKLTNIVTKYNNPIIFVPLGIGNNVDHILVRDLCLKEYPNVIFWSDVPYNSKYTEQKAFIKKNKLKRFVFKENTTAKHEMIKLYKTQFLPLFPDGKIPPKPDILYSTPSLYKSLML